MKLNLQQRTLLAGFFANWAIVLMGFGLTDQPLMTHRMTGDLRAGIMMAGAVSLAIGIWIERILRRR